MRLCESQAWTFGGLPSSLIMKLVEVQVEAEVMFNFNLKNHAMSHFLLHSSRALCHSHSIAIFPPEFPRVFSLSKFNFQQPSRHVFIVTFIWAYLNVVVSISWGK